VCVAFSSRESRSRFAASCTDIDVAGRPDITLDTEQAAG